MGPYYLTAIVALLGPISRVAGFASTRTRERTIEIGPRTGERFTASTPTHTTRGDAARERRHGEPRRELRGARPVHLRPRDPRHRGRARCCPTRTPSAARCGSSAAAAAGRTCPYASRGAADARGIGLHDMVEAIARRTGRTAPPGRLGRARGRGRARHPALGRGGAHRRDRVAASTSRSRCRFRPSPDRQARVSAVELELAELDPADLPGERLRQLGDELDPARVRVRREAFADDVL